MHEKCRAALQALDMIGFAVRVFIVGVGCLIITSHRLLLLIEIFRSSGYMLMGHKTVWRRIGFPIVTR